MTSASMRRFARCWLVVLVSYYLAAAAMQQAAAAFSSSCCRRRAFAVTRGRIQAAAASGAGFVVSSAFFPSAAQPTAGAGRGRRTNRRRRGGHYYDCGASVAAAAASTVPSPRRRLPARTRALGSNAARSSSSSSSSIRPSFEGCYSRIHRGGGSGGGGSSACGGSTVLLGAHRHDDAVSEASQAKSASGKSSSSSTSGTKFLVPGVGLASLAAVTAAAKLGILPGPYAASDVLIAQDVSATVVTAALGYGFVKFVSTRGIDPRDSRKVIHTASAPAFMLFWPIFSQAPGAKFFAAIVPALNALRLYLAGTGSGEAGDGESGKRKGGGESELARAVSRSGGREEALGGPFIYVLILASSVLLFWRSSPVGIVALATMAAGDGMADLIGRRYGKTNKWPGLDKSVAGTAAFFVASTVASTALLLWMQYWGCLSLPYNDVDVLLRVAVISLVTAILELVPIADDNYTVPVSAAILASILLQ